MTFHFAEIPTNLLIGSVAKIPEMCKLGESLKLFFSLLIVK